MITPRYGVNLENYYFSQNCKFSKISIYSLAIDLIKNLKILHDAGYVYNDVKLDNIMTGFNVELPKTYT